MLAHYHRAKFTHAYIQIMNVWMFCVYSARHMFRLSSMQMQPDMQSYQGQHKIIQFSGVLDPEILTYSHHAMWNSLILVTASHWWFYKVWIYWIIHVCLPYQFALPCLIVLSSAVKSSISCMFFKKRYISFMTDFHQWTQRKPHAIGTLMTRGGRWHQRIELLSTSTVNYN